MEMPQGSADSVALGIANEAMRRSKAGEPINLESLLDLLGEAIGRLPKEAQEMLLARAEVQADNAHTYRLKPQEERPEGLIIPDGR